jgi:predicted HTH transcriptional regulator
VTELTVTSKGVTMSPPNTVDEAAGLIRERIKELDSERAKLERALASLTGGREGRRGPGRPRGATASSPTRRRRRRRRGGTRADQAVKLVAENPGISASEIAKRMRIKPNYLYRVLAELEKEGKVRKDGRAYHPA